jgi:hypothetical protein
MSDNEQITKILAMQRNPRSRNFPMLVKSFLMLKTVSN